MTAEPFDCPPMDPALDLAAPVVVLAPHSDDETLGCGGTLALLAEHVPVHVVYMTDGRRSPIGPDGNPAPDADRLVEARRQEAREAMEVLGVPAGNLHFLGHPDGSLSGVEARAEGDLAAILGRLRPGTVLAPFRHDQHPDHLATHRIARRIADRDPGITLRQYFVYNRYPLMSGADIRRAVDRRHLRRVDIGATRDVKRRALDRYASQVTARYPWQKHPVIAPATLERLCAGDEVFASFDAATGDRALFGAASPRFWLSLRFGPRAVTFKKRYLG